MTYSETTIRAAIKTAILTVSNCGAVHDYERFIAENFSDLISLMTVTIGSSTQLRGWFITTPSGGKFTTEELIAFQGGGDEGTVLVTYTYVLRFFMAVDDSAATEKTTTALLLAVCDAIKDSTTLQKYHFDDDVPTIKDVSQQYATFAGVLTHFGEIIIQLQEVV